MNKILWNLIKNNDKSGSPKFILSLSFTFYKIKLIFFRHIHVYVCIYIYTRARMCVRAYVSVCVNFYRDQTDSISGWKDIH